LSIVVLSDPLRERYLALPAAFRPSFAHQPLRSRVAGVTEVEMYGGWYLAKVTVRPPNIAVHGRLWHAFVCLDDGRESMRAGTAETLDQALEAGLGSFKEQVITFAELRWEASKQAAVSLPGDGGFLFRKRTALIAGGALMLVFVLAAFAVAVFHA
jgi:hypothetical protein